MLPPVNAGQTTVCVQGKSQVLTWDGRTAIACNGDFTIDQNNHNIQLPQAATINDCDAAHAGSMRWNNSTAKFEGCNGTVWSSFGGGAEWVNIPQGWVSEGYGLNTLDPNSNTMTLTQVFGPNYQTNYTPNSWCQEKGYTAASGACISNSAQGILMAINGSAGSLSSYSHSWFCGNVGANATPGLTGNAIVSAAPSQILCVK